MSDDRETSASNYQEKIAYMTDAELQALYLFAGGIADDPWGDALAAACKERKIDI